MSIPDFDENGNLPPGRHKGGVEEIRKRLVDPFDQSRTRSGIFMYWQHHREALLDIVEVRAQWLSGSFTSAKPEPNDMDLVTVLDGPAYDELPRHRQLVVRMLIAGIYTEAFWRCDVYPVLTYPLGHPGHNASEVAAASWEHHFGHDRDGAPRGFVEISS